MNKEKEFYYTFEEKKTIESNKEKIKQLQEQAFADIRKIVGADKCNCKQLKEITNTLDKEVKAINNSSKKFGIPLFKNGNRIAIPNYLSKWYRYDKNLPLEKYAWVIEKNSKTLLHVNEYSHESKSCIVDDYSGQSSVGVLLSPIKPIEEGMSRFLIPTKNLLPLVEIETPAVITTNDFFYTDGEYWPSVRSIESFSSNPWSGAIDSFGTFKGSYSPRRAFGVIKSSWRMIQGSKELDKALKIKRK